MSKTVFTPTDLDGIGERFALARVAPELVAASSDDQFMVLAGFRYCLLRQSYAGSLCREWLKAHWSQINAGTQNAIVRDLTMALVDGEAGSPNIDAPKWREFGSWAWATLRPEQQTWVLEAVTYKRGEAAPYQWSGGPMYDGGDGADV